MAKIIVVGCVDERLPEVVQAFLNSHGQTGQYLLANTPAPSLNFKDQDRTLTKVAAVKGASEVWLIDHLNCGGYTLAGEDDSEENHEKHLASAKGELEGEYGFRTVRTFIASQNDEKEWEIKEVHV